MPAAIPFMPCQRLHFLVVPQAARDVLIRLDDAWADDAAPPATAYHACVERWAVAGERDLVQVG